MTSLDELARGRGDRVARLELYHFAAPLPSTFRPAWIPGFPQNENRATLVRIVTESGVEGWSAGPAIGRERLGLGDLVGPYLIGEDATDVHLVQQRLREMSYLGWRNWWIEPAFWDVKAKIEGVPLWKLLGGRPETVTVYASSGEVRTAEERIEEVHARYEEGFRTIKIRVHEDEQADMRQIRRVAAALPDEMRVAVDANQAWRVDLISPAPTWDLDRARRFADICAELGVAWIEEPLPMDSYDDQAALAEYSQVPIAGGELHSSGYSELKMMVERRCYDVFQPDAMFTGGVFQTMRTIQLCRDHGLAYTPHTWTNGVGFAVNLHLFLASGFESEYSLEYPVDPPGWVPEARDAMLTEPWMHRSGRLDAPQKPGLGIEIDKRALRDHATRFFVMDRKRLVWFALRDRGVKAAREIERNKRARSDEGR